MKNRLKVLYHSSPFWYSILHGPKYFYDIVIAKLIPDKKYIVSQYKKKLGIIPNIDNPNTFTEKIQWLKLNDRNPIYTLCADKIRVREYVKGKIGSKYIIPCLYELSSPQEIPFLKLPSQYVIKTNHSSGTNIIVDKNDMYINGHTEKLDYEKIRFTLKKWLETSFYYVNREWEYKDIVPKILIEKFLQQEGNKSINDYKIHCFNGEPKFIQTISDRQTFVKEDWFNLDWSPLDLYYFSPNKKFPTKPKEFDELLTIAKKLSEDFNYVRVDLYLVNGDVYFGELTFRPYGGYMEFRPIEKEWDIKIGNLLFLK